MAKSQPQSKPASRPIDKHTVFRVRFVIDQDSRFEECNGEARPLTEAEYVKEGQYRGCPDHPRAGSVVVDASRSPNIVACEVCGITEWVDIPYAEYLAYYSNPKMHVYLGCVVSTECDTCGHAINDYVESLWSIDMMKDSRELKAIRIGEKLTPQAAISLPGYLAEVAKELLDEAGYRP